MEHETKLKVVKVDGAENYETAVAHRVRFFPTMILYRAGRVIGELSGYQTKERLEKWIAELAGP
jgi:thioredoxin-like negative regulator of GroEL